MGSETSFPEILLINPHTTVKKCVRKIGLTWHTASFFKNKAKFAPALRKTTLCNLFFCGDFSGSWWQGSPFSVSLSFWGDHYALGVHDLRRRHGLEIFILKELGLGLHHIQKVVTKNLPPCRGKLFSSKNWGNLTAPSLNVKYPKKMDGLQYSPL